MGQATLCDSIQYMYLVNDDGLMFHVPFNII